MFPIIRLTKSPSASMRSRRRYMSPSILTLATRAMVEPWTLSEGRNDEDRDGPLGAAEDGPDSGRVHPKIPQTRGVRALPDHQGLPRAKGRVSRRPGFALAMLRNSSDIGPAKNASGPASGRTMDFGGRRVAYGPSPTPPWTPRHLRGADRRAR